MSVLDEAFLHCNEALTAHSLGKTEMDGEKSAINAAKLLDNTRWTVIPSAKYAEYLVFSAQQLFNRIISDISDVDSVHEIMEY